MGYSPENFSGQYDGMVPAREALSRSLNIPFVFLLQKLGLEVAYEGFKNLGFNFDFPASHYGLSFILGGAEVSLEELVNAYSYLGQTLINSDNYTYPLCSAVIPRPTHRPTFFCYSLDSAINKSASSHSTKSNHNRQPTAQIGSARASASASASAVCFCFCFCFCF